MLYILEASHALAFLLLFASLLLALGGAAWRLAAGAFLVTLTAGGIAGLIAPQGIAFALSGLLLAWLSRRFAQQDSMKYWRALCIVLLALLALALGFHALPGFARQTLMSNFGRSASLSLVWHFDKGIGGLLLLMVCSAPARAADYRRLIVVLLACPTVIVTLALQSGIATFDPRWLQGTTAWLIGNLFLTVVAEEAFFRGLLQHHLGQWLERRIAYGAWLGIVLVAVLFAIVHAPWGMAFALGAGIAGVFYGCLYRWGGLQWAVAGHVLSNAALLVFSRSPLG